MKRVLIFSSLLVVIILFCLFFFNQGEQCSEIYQKKNKYNFDSTLLLFREDIYTCKTLPTHPEFVEIFNHPECYFNDVVSFLQCFNVYKNSNNRDKPPDSTGSMSLAVFDYYHAMCTMQKLQVDQYIVLCEISEQLLNEGLISEMVFHVVFDGANNFSVINSNKNNKKVKSYILNLLLNPNISRKFKERLIRNYLS